MKTLPTLDVAYRAFSGSLGNLGKVFESISQSVYGGNI